MSKINLIDLQKRKLEKCYTSLTFFTEDIKIRTDGCFSVKKLYVLLGIDITGNRKVLATYFENNEYNRFWLEVFEDLKSRGLERVLFLVTPHNKNIERCAKIIYNGINIVYSPDELIVDITRFFSEKSTRKFVKNLKDLFFAHSLQNHLVELKMFQEQFSNNKIVLLLLDKKELEIKKFYQYNYEIRKFLYPYYAIREIYSIELSEETLSNMTKSVSDEVTKWQTRPLETCYPFVYVDCLYCHVKEDLRSVKKAIYVVLGVNIQGTKDVLGIWIDNTESATKWCEIFYDLKTRGVKDIFFVSMDGLSGLPEAVEKVYPQAIMQRCIVHITRSIYAITANKDCKVVIADFKKIYTANNLEHAKLEFESFIQKYENNKSLVNKVKNNIEWIYRIFEYPPAIRKVIYTTNAIESLNAGLRKVTKGKGSFVNETALMKVLYLRITDLQMKWSKGISNWKNVQNELVQIFEERYLQYIEN